MKMTVFWYVTWCSLVYRFRCSRGTCFCRLNVRKYLFHPDDRGTLFIRKVGNHLLSYTLAILCKVFIFVTYSAVYMTVWNAICVTYSSSGVLKCWRIFALSKSRSFPMHHTISWSHVLPGDRKQCVKISFDKRKRVVLSQHFFHTLNLCISVIPTIIWGHTHCNGWMFAVECISYSGITDLKSWPGHLPGWLKYLIFSEQIPE
jgi:hypothetical protein